MDATFSRVMPSLRFARLVALRAYGFILHKPRDLLAKFSCKGYMLLAVLLSVPPVYVARGCNPSAPQEAARIR